MKWDETYECWVIPFNCACCKKCWLKVEPNGKPIFVRDDNEYGKLKIICVHGGPYKGYQGIR